MTKHLPPIIIIIAILFAPRLSAQYPQYFAHNDEHGLPSNEVYSILQDDRGFIWIAGDAGLYKFDGVRYISYKSKTQRSKSITGLTRSSSGRIYCYNFESQIFYLKQDVLRELPHTLPKTIINNIAADSAGNIYIAHDGGITRYNEITQQWQAYSQNGINSPAANRKTTRTIKGHTRTSILFICPDGIGIIENGTVRINHQADLLHDMVPGKVEMEYLNKELWIFSKEKGSIHRYSNNRLETISNKKWTGILAGRKINNVKALSDGNLWICTYKGIIQFNPKNDSARLFYPHMSFSDCIIDREHNYWFTTLQSGILRVPHLDYTVWNDHDRISKTETDNTHIFFATGHGTIGRLHPTNNQIRTFYTGNDADIQSLDYDESEKVLRFNINNDLYQLQNNSIEKTESSIHAIKTVQRVGTSLFTASSHGFFIDGKRMNRHWTRQIKHDTSGTHVWTATNRGVQKYDVQQGTWQLSASMLEETAITAIDIDPTTLYIYALTWDGKLYLINQQNKPDLITTLPPETIGHQIKYHQNRLYTATNKGIYCSDLHNRTSISVNKLSGLASDNIRDLEILSGHLWLATGQGLQKIPLPHLEITRPAAKVYLKNKDFQTAHIRLDHGQTLLLYPEASTYTSHKKFQYAYRLNGSDWTKLPGTIEKIAIPNIPSGTFEAKLKVIDHKGNDSENIITIKGYVRPPFWQTWWFILLLITSSAIVLWFIIRNIISGIRTREQEKTQLANSQLTALKARMNPHFMCNTINSIQALILKQDIKNSNLYLNRFSELMRKVLDVSGREEITLREETEILELYLSLEQLRFGSNFTYRIHIAAGLDTHSTHLPPLMLQPFIENAIKHGLLHKKGEKRLVISLEQDNDCLTCRIRDNGIGRKRSEEIQKRQRVRHHSFATEATKTRLELLNQTNRKKNMLTINDLYEEGRASGTEVIFKFG